MRILIVVLSLVVMAGCVTRPQMNREEWLATTSRTYQGVTKDQVLIAGEKLFRLADGDDFLIVHTDDGLYATRIWSVYLVLAAAMGTDYWTIKTAHVDGGIRASVQVNSQSQAITPMPTTGQDWTAGTTPMAGSPVMGTAIYDVFWARMDYLLGKSQEWMPCSVSNARMKQRVVWGTNEALCNSFNLKDAHPNPPPAPPCNAAKVAGVRNLTSSCEPH